MFLQIKNKLIEHTFEVSSFLFFVGPMIVICALYILIGIKLHKSKLLHGVNRKGCPDVNSSHKNNANTSSGQARVIRMLGKQASERVLGDNLLLFLLPSIVIPRRLINGPLPFQWLWWWLFSCAGSPFTPNA